jgi:hypothetical protein
MLGMVDFCTTQSKSSDPLLLDAYVQQLVGQPFLQFRFSYGDELSIHLGKATKYATPRLKHLSKGSYILGARASNWRINTSAPPKMLIGCQDSSRAKLRRLSVADVESSSVVKKKARVVFAKVLPEGESGRVLSYVLTITFSDDSTFCILPPREKARHSSDDVVADWELFTPHERYLRVGPGPTWSYLPSCQDRPRKPPHGRARRRA